MKIKTPFNTAPFTPKSDDIQYCGQISDHPLFPGKIGRLLVITKYMADGDNHRLTVYGYLIHVDLDTGEKVTSFKDSLEDWVVTDAYKVVLRNASGYMIENSEFVQEEDRIEGEQYSESQLTPYKVLPAYVRFARMLKTYTVPAQMLFQKIVDMEDEFNSIFDVYGNIYEYMINKPVEFKNPENPINREIPSNL
ncbi:hypothetical protein [Chryseobacterium sp. R2A-55]|uniref:hypothetical protein n=1 Tax=Chryseobacterium sp. R2A-55 TaxID=2744445 RepID=UPI001F26CAE1|nr:hypothetical protein [Chryseobacterium sp. R2A-55]